MADVYDALVGKRVYKDAYSHEQAMKMILNGECGAFNPLLMEVLVEIRDKIKKKYVTRHKKRRNVRHEKSSCISPNELCIINEIFILYTKNKKMKDEEENLSILEGNKGCYLQLSRSIM